MSHTDPKPHRHLYTKDWCPGGEECPGGPRAGEQPNDEPHFWTLDPHTHAGTDCGGGDDCPGKPRPRHDHRPDEVCRTTCPVFVATSQAAAVEFDAVKDSGARREWSTGSVRDVSTGKGRYDLLPPYAIQRLARHFENGAAKYGDRNWEKGQPLSTYIDSALRHGFNVSEGKQDEDHAAAACWNWLAFMHTANQIRLGNLPAELDDIGWIRPIDSV